MSRAPEESNATDAIHPMPAHCRTAFTLLRDACPDPQTQASAANSPGTAGRGAARFLAPRALALDCAGSGAV